MDDFFRAGHRFGVIRGDADKAAVVDVDLDAGFFDDGADLFAAWADDDADLAWLDLQGFDARASARAVGSGGANPLASQDGGQADMVRGAPRPARGGGQLPGKAGSPAARPVRARELQD